MRFCQSLTFTRLSHFITFTSAWKLLRPILAFRSDVSRAWRKKQRRKNGGRRVSTTIRDWWCVFLSLTNILHSYERSMVQFSQDLQLSNFTSACTKTINHSERKPSPHVPCSCLDNMKWYYGIWIEYLGVVWNIPEGYSVTPTGKFTIGQIRAIVLVEIGES